MIKIKIQNQPDDPKLQDERKNAELEVQESAAQVEKAFHHLHEKIEEGAQTIKLIKQVSREPLLFSASAFVAGIYLGKALLQAIQKQKLPPKTNLLV